MKLWRAMNLVLGVPAAVLAAVSAGTGLASQSVNHVPAVLALVAAGFGAALTTLNPSRRMSSAQAAANAYLEIQTSARQLLTVDLSILDRADARDHLATLTARRDEINKTADPPALFASQKARKSITGGRQSYEADKGK